MSDKIGEIALMFCMGDDNMGQIANRMLIEVIFKAMKKPGVLQFQEMSGSPENQNLRGYENGV